MRQRGATRTHHPEWNVWNGTTHRQGVLQWTPKPVAILVVFVACSGSQTRQYAAPYG